MGNIVGATNIQQQNQKEIIPNGVNSHRDIVGFVQWISMEEAIKLALDAYNVDKKTSVLGWEVQKIYNDKSSGFLAKLYKKGDKYVFVTAGTDMLSGRDWLNNVQQQLGFESQQYNKSIEIAKDLAHKYPNLVFVGHSLGGGLASANSRATGNDAITFNASALNEKYNGKMKSKIAAYISNGDILDYTNQYLLHQNIEGYIIRYNVKYTRLPNLQGIPHTGRYQAIRGILIHNDLEPM